MATSFPTTSLQPGSTGSSVLQLQQWLVEHGYMTQSDMNSGPGIYGPKTTAAVKNLQSALGVDNSSGPGYYGPHTIAAIQGSGGTAPAGGSAGGSTGGTGAGMPSVALKPGQTGPEVAALQNFLVQHGYMTPEQVNTGPGIYGPQTTAAVKALQADLGVENASGPGYFGPKTMAAVQTALSGGGGAAGGGTGGTGGSTGNANLDKILESIQGLIDTNKAVIPAGMQITPDLVKQFVSWAHQAVDPQTKQLIDSEITNVNASLENIGKQYDATKGEVLQQFGTNLATEQNQAGGSGTAFSGLRNLTEKNMVASTNRTLAALNSSTEYNAGQAAREGGARVGAGDAGRITLPGLFGATVGNEGGSRGTVASGNSLNFNYRPETYTAGEIPTNQNTAVNNLAGNYLSQYGTLAATNSGRSMSDLIKGITGLPSGYQIPTNLM